MPVPVFSVGEVLTAANMNQVGLWLVATLSFTNDATPQIDNCFTQNFDNYLILFNNTSNSADTTILYKLVDGTTPNTANNTTSTGFYLTFTNGNYNANFNAATTYGFVGYGDQTNGGGFSLTLYNPNNAVNTYGIADGAGNDFANRWYMRHATTTQYEGIEFSNATAATMTGTIRVYGYRK